MAEKKKPKVVIGMPCTDVVRAMTAQAIASAVVGAEGCVIDVVMRRSCEIASSRVYLVNHAMKVGATHLLFVDSDMTFPHKVIPLLLAHKKDIVGVEYNRRMFPLEGTSKPLTKASDSLYEGAFVGAGLMLIDLSIFNKEWVDKNGKKAAWFSFGRDSQGMLVVGEDAWFCYTARDNGFSIWIDPTIKVGHVGEYVY